MSYEKNNAEVKSVSALDQYIYYNNFLFKVSVITILRFDDADLNLYLISVIQLFVTECSFLEELIACNLLDFSKFLSHSDLIRT